MNIYVGNLPYAVVEEELTQLFSAYGKVASVSVIRDRETGQSKGFGFVEMPVAEEAQAAIAGLNGTQHKGRQLNVNEARPRPEGGSRDRGGYGGGSRGGGGGGGSRRGGDFDGGSRGSRRSSW